MAKTLILNWGVYDVRVTYENANNFSVVYHGGSYDGNAYRKLTDPELQAIRSAILGTADPIPSHQFRYDTELRDRLARDYLSKLTGPFKLGTIKKAFAFADEFMRERSASLPCPACGKKD